MFCISFPLKNYLCHKALGMEHVAEVNFYLPFFTGNSEVYHHCLFGTRYDFLCANYTAFDQKTFICHFASEVDCVNSKKFWHRNDALYKAASTTTIKPFVIYTPPPQAPPVTVSPQALPSVPLNPPGPAPRRPVGGRRRPFRRRRPQFDYYEDDYYDDYYDDRPRSNRGRKRPRPRPRPVYDDEYDEEYEDDRYERRGGGRRDEKRRPYDRRPNGKRRNQDRIKPDYDEDTDRFEDEDFQSHGRRKPNDDRRKPYNDEPDDERYPENKKQNKRRPLADRSEEEEKRPRKGQRRPISDDYEDDTFQREDTRSYERPRKTDERRARPKDESKTIIKPVSGTIYDRPRVAPRIKLPVPKNEANKYAYKPVGSTEASVIKQDEDYYDDYEDSLPKRKNNRPVADFRNTSPKIKEDSRKETKRPDASYESSVRTRFRETRPRSKTPISAEYYDDYEEYEDEDQEEKRPASNNEKRGKPSSTTSTTTSTTTTTEKPIEKVKQPIIRLVKRPFLPSRGGNPYAARGLQPVGAKALEEKTQNEEQVRETLEQSSRVFEDETLVNQQSKATVNQDSDEVKPIFKPSPVMINVPVRPKLVTISSDSFRSYSTEDSVGPRTTQNPNSPDRNPLDINEEEYDVTLNDALNPTLPNVPVRESPAGFSPSNDYVALSNFQRSRYVLEPVASQTGSEYAYQTKPLVNRERLVSSNPDYNGQYSTYRETYRPRRVQQRTEALYSRY